MALSMLDKAAEKKDESAWSPEIAAEFAREANNPNPCVGSTLLSENERSRVWIIRLAPGERIGFKALCHLLQATGLPFLGVNSPLSPESTGMPALLRSDLTWMLNVPVFLQGHHGWHETSGRPGDRQRNVRGQFEKLKTLAPEHFAHLQFPTHYQMD